MSNPFLSYSEEAKTQYVTSVCSVNRGRIAVLPVKGIADDILGKTAHEIFSTELVVKEIKALAELRGVALTEYTDKNLPKFLDDATYSDDIMKKSIADAVIKKFGNRLGMILLALKLGQEENRRARTDWTDEHWEYWANLKTVILTGGLSGGLLGRRLKEQILYVFDMAGVKPYDIMLFDNGSHIGTMGCARLLPCECKGGAVLDFGQTNIKRTIVRKRRGEISEIITLDTKPSMYMELNTEDTPENRSEALKLHKYLLNVLADTCKQGMKLGGMCDSVVISIANYTVGGELVSDRGGYAKLCLLDKNYARLLSHELSSKLHREFDIRLVHDGTAIGLYFSDVPDSICLSLGTAFGVGFTDIKLS